MDKIDLRSDTVTHPTPKMREAMANAPVGDDVYGDDPTVNRLEALAAERLAKEAALFVTSGTQGNIISLFAQCGRGDEIIVGNNTHISLSEGGNPATFGGISARSLPTTPDGRLPLEAITEAIRADDPHYPRTALVTVENTHANTGGNPLPVDYMDAVGALCQAHGLKFHIDGARIFNAAVALNVDVARLVQPADTVSFCISKGLCAPVGAIIVGSEEFIYHARRLRKQLGGGMRQAGILAAAGIIALEEMTERLAEDHATACQLAEGMATIPAIEIDPSRTVTNFVMWRLHPDAPKTPEQLISALAGDGIVARLPRGGVWRFLTHYWIKPHHVEIVVNSLRRHLA
jgi:threonine aldolase